MGRWLVVDAVDADWGVAQGPGGQHIHLADALEIAFRGLGNIQSNLVINPRP